MMLAQAPTGTIAGTVLDSQTGRPIPGASVLLNGQQASGQKADADGRFQLEVKVEEVAVTAGQVTEASTVMANKSVVTTVEVDEKVTAAGANAEAMLTERKLAGSVSDSIGKEEISNSTSSSAAGALEKVTGVSVVGDGFVYVRGLGERYSSTMMNGAVLPATEPEKRVVTLDLFPSALIASIRVLKTYTPDLPGEFAGGLVQMQTIEFPSQKMFQVNTKAGFNTATTFNEFQTAAGGRPALPSQIPTSGRLIAGAYTPAQLQSFGQSFTNSWQPSVNSSQRPNTDLSIVGGGTFKRVGIASAITFGNSAQTLAEKQRYYRQGGTGPITFTDYPDFNDYTQTAKLGAVFNVAIRLDEKNLSAIGHGGRSRRATRSAQGRHEGRLGHCHRSRRTGHAHAGRPTARLYGNSRPEGCLYENQRRHRTGPRDRRDHGQHHLGQHEVLLAQRRRGGEERRDTDDRTRHHR